MQTAQPWAGDDRRFRTRLLLGRSVRWVGGCRRELLDHVIPLNEKHLRRLLREYVDYFQHDRIHDALAKDTPMRSAMPFSQGDRMLVRLGLRPV